MKILAPSSEIVETRSFIAPTASDSQTDRWTRRCCSIRPWSMTLLTNPMSMFPPDKRRQTFLYCDGILPDMTAATGTAPAPSQMMCCFSIKNRMAAEMVSSLTVTTST
ncbi:hypothetical protein BLNAU_890 [Blattamonas nauphoetae]|uniref:Uncharacterized protein n=1 Tax=Blattamonas nauphoetae TaxID=2049346 RepID=A0ABQ9YKT2_9EUKA|nr:hypothetical protein BLNAU_890 [Blattamonas nauphoetae]